MLVFAAHTPHSPLLLEEINKDRLAQVKKTKNAMKELSDELYAVHPDTIILLSAHPTVEQKAFSIAVSDPYIFDISEFGQFNFERKIHPDIMLIDRLQRSLRSSDQPITLNTDESLSYAAAVPIELLTERLPNVKLVPITYSNLDAKAHFQFGQAMKDEVMASNKRIAIIVSADLSHALNTESPAGFHADGPIYDEKIQELIIAKNTAGLLRMDEDLVKNAQQTNYRLLCILFGLLEHTSVTPQILSYESPFGVGYITANFALH